MSLDNGGKEVGPEKTEYDQYLDSITQKLSNLFQLAEIRRIEVVEGSATILSITSEEYTNLGLIYIVDAQSSSTENTALFMALMKTGGDIVLDSTKKGASIMWNVFFSKNGGGSGDINMMGIMMEVNQGVVTDKGRKLSTVNSKLNQIIYCAEKLTVFHNLVRTLIKTIPFAKKIVPLVYTDILIGLDCFAGFVKGNEEKTQEQ